MKRLITIASLCLLGSATAHAQLSASGGSPGFGIAGYNGAPLGFTGTFNDAELSLAELSRLSFNALVDAGVGGTLEVTYFGTEAASKNQFTVGGLTIDNKVNVADFDTRYSVAVGPGAIDFSFLDVTRGTTLANGAAGSGRADSNSYFAFDNTDGFYAFFPDSDPDNARVFDFIIGFNDGNNDFDYDDLVIGVNLTPVPEPETYALMLVGLGALGVVARRRRAR